MRTTTKIKKISVHEHIHKRLIKDRDNFEKVIGGGNWSINDTLAEYFKILDSLKPKGHTK